MKVIHANKINQLPAELLVQIFLLTLTPTLAHKDRYPHLRLSSVCRYWRRVTNGHALFWTVIYFSPWKGEQFIRESVTRSRSAKLSVFSPNYHEVCSYYGDISRIGRAQIREIVATFINLLQTEGHRIKFLDLVENSRCKLSRAVLAKGFPALTTFILHENDPKSDSFAIIKAAKSLKNLDIDLHGSIGVDSLFELKPSFERLINLNVRYISAEMKRQIFFSILPSCYKLESLTVSGSQHYWNAIHLPSVITLTSLISLNVDCYSLIHKLRAPALRRLNVVHGFRRLVPNQHGYLIFDEYDVSPVTQLVIKGFEILHPQDSLVAIEGLTGSKSCSKNQLTPYETDYGHPDFRGDNSGPTQFYIGLPTYDIPLDGVAPPDFKPSPALSKIFSKLHNLVRLYISPFEVVCIVPHFSKSILESLKAFLNSIFNNLVSSNIKWLAIRKVRMDVNIVRLIFDLFSNSFSLSNLDTIELGTSHSCWNSSVPLRTFAEELVNSLKLRQKAGYRALPRFEVDVGAALLPEECIAEAAVLGTQVVQYRENYSGVRE